MSDRSFPSAVQMIDGAKAYAPDIATRRIFDRYRTADQDQRDVIVLALIGQVVTEAARRRTDTSRASESA